MGDNKTDSKNKHSAKTVEEGSDDNKNEEGENGGDKCPEGLTLTSEKIVSCPTNDLTFAKEACFTVKLTNKSAEKVSIKKLSFSFNDSSGKQLEDESKDKELKAIEPKKSTVLTKCMPVTE